MILPMKKVCLVVQDRHRGEAIHNLRDLGLVHLNVVNTPPETASSMVERRNQINSAIGLLQKVKKKKETGQSKIDSSVLLEKIVHIIKERKELQNRITVIKREITRIEKWGDINPDSVNELSKELPVFFYELKPDVFTSIPEDVRYIKISSGKYSVKIIVLDSPLPSGLVPANLAPLQFPEKSLSAFYKEIEEINLKLKLFEDELESFAAGTDTLIKEKIIIEQDIEYEKVFYSMENIELTTPASSTDIPAEHSLSFITGYIPKEDIESLKKTVIKESWALSADDPEETDEKVPTKLKNNKFVSLLNPITDFLGIIPGYREVDISSWFLLFFCIFFGMIFGDAAYGILLTVTALTGIIITARKKVSQPFQLLLLLGIFNTIWGVMNCSWFGAEIEKVPQVLQDISFSYFSSAKTDQAIVDQNLQIFCFSIALLHLTIAHIKVIFNNIKSIKVLSEIGAIGMLWGMYNLVLFLVVSNEEVRSIPLLPVSLYLLAGGFFLSFIFSYYEGSIIKSILSSCKNLISVILGLANIFSDIMSYIRLWAVGLAGAAIASTINTLAGPMLGNFLIFAGIILLVFGHGLNLVLNVLSVVVHGVRLNTLEFSGHLGLSWSGTAYRPFSIKKI